MSVKKIGWYIAGVVLLILIALPKLKSGKKKEDKNKEKN